jgi:transcriptional regulator with XRE-family HTH domain
MFFHMRLKGVIRMPDDVQKKVFSKNLNNLLYLNDKTQKEVADAIGVSTQTFNTWVRGVALPRMGKVQLLADYFQIKKSDLIETKGPAVNSDVVLTAHEKRLISHYRSADAGTQAAVDKLLDLPGEEKRGLSAG